jgi:quinoprotein glucose dehydrogenase
MEMIAGGFAMVADIAIAPDGRVIVAERSGRIHILGDGRMRDDPATSLQPMLNGGRLLALALDPRFARTHFVYVLYTELAEESHASRDKAAAPLVETFTLARLRESGGTLGDALVVLDGVRASPHPAAALRFGPDGKLFAAFDTGPDARLAGDAASLNGKIVRLNADGTTPGDQPGATPAIANGLVGPVGLAWQPSSGTLWSADRRDRTSQLRTVTEGAPTVYALPDDVSPTTIAFARGVDGPDGHDELLIGSEGRTSLLKVSIDRRTARPVKTERLLEDSESGPPVADRSPNTVRALAVGPDGTIYVATPTAVGRIKEWGPSVR